MQNHLLVTVERSGGFAGLRTTWKVDGASLGEPDATALAKLADAFLDAGFSTDAPAMPDAFCHAVTVETDSGRRSIRLHGDCIPPAADALIGWVKAKALQSS